MDATNGLTSGEITSSCILQFLSRSPVRLILTHSPYAPISISRNHFPNKLPVPKPACSFFRTFPSMYLQEHGPLPKVSVGILPVKHEKQLRKEWADKLECIGFLPEKSQTSGTMLQ